MDGHAPLHGETLACWLMATALPAGLAALLHVLCHDDLEAHVAEPLPFAVLSLGAVLASLVLHARGNEKPTAASQDPHRIASKESFERSELRMMSKHLRTSRSSVTMALE